MKVRRIAGLVGVVVAASLVSAEDVSPDITTGSKAVLFTISGLDGLGAGAYNAGIGGKYYLMNPIALRASLAFSATSQKVPTTAASGGTDGSQSGMMFGISAGAEYHLSFARVTPYAGGLLSFFNVSNKVVSPINVANGPKTTTTNSSGLTGLGVLGYVPQKSFVLGGIGGVEFFITKEVSLGAEYQLGWHLPLGYESKVKTEGTPSTESTTKYVGYSEFSISNNGALTLSVYF